MSTPSILLTGPRGKLYLNPEAAPDFLAYLGLFMGYAESGLQRAKRSHKNAPTSATKAQIAYWRDVQKALRWMMKTCHRGIDPADFDTATFAVDPTLTEWLKSSPLAKAQRAAGGDHVA